MPQYIFLLSYFKIEWKFHKNQKQNFETFIGQPGVTEGKVVFDAKYHHKRNVSKSIDNFMCQTLMLLIRYLRYPEKYRSVAKRLFNIYC